MRLTAGPPLGIVLVLFVAGQVTALPAQVGRDALTRGTQAHELADFETAVRLLSRGLDPAAGPRDAAWRMGLHKLVDALIEQERGAMAEVWLRWALRLEPNITFDSVNFASAVKQAFDEARAAVTSSPMESGLASARWEWGDPASTSTQGALRIEAEVAGVVAQIEGGAIVAPSAPRIVAPGSYTVDATADGHLPARVTAEVLPGVTTILTIKLAPAPPGFLYVASRPWGIVSVDGERVGYTTLAAHRITVGVRRLRIEREGYFPFDTTLTVTHNQRLRLGTIHLRPRSR